MLIATVEDVLRAVRDFADCAYRFACEGEDIKSALRRLEHRGLVDAFWLITPCGHEYIRRAEAGWQSDNSAALEAALARGE